MRPTKVADREKFDLVVNGDFFSARGIKDAEGTNSKFSSAIWSSVEGPAMTDGQAWSASPSNRPLSRHSQGQKRWTSKCSPALSPMIGKS